MKILTGIFLINIYFAGCTGPEGPRGLPGSDAIQSSTDRSVQPKVIYTNPPANSAGPYANFGSTITVRFNKIMDPASIRQSVRLTSPFNIIADTNSFRTIGGDVYTFNAVDPPFYSGRWIIGQVCTLKILQTAKDINGNFLRAPYMMTFLPEPSFRIKSISPASSASKVSVSSTFYLYFNSPVDSAIFSSIHILPSSTGYWYISNYYGDSTQISYSNLYPLEPDTTYSITIDSSAMDKRGNKLHNNFFSAFHTEPFRITSSYPANGSTNVSIGQMISIGLNCVVDTGSVREAFSMNPPVELHFSMSEYNFKFGPTSAYADSTKYIVTFSTALRTLSGKRLAEPFTFSFTTGNLSKR